MDNCYLNKDGTLKDNKILADFDTVKEMYQNGEIIEVGDILLCIADAIRQAQ